jgi:hypothetical protein
VLIRIIGNRDQQGANVLLGGSDSFLCVALDERVKVLVFACFWCKRERKKSDHVIKKIIANILGNAGNYQEGKRNR